MAVPMEIRPILQTSLNNLDELNSNKQDSSSVDSSLEFNHDEFWEKLRNAAKIVSHETTKLCLGFSKQPYPNKESCTQLCHGLETSCLALIITANELPKEYGSVLKENIRVTLSSVVSSVKDLISGLLSSKVIEHRQLTATGNVWEFCEEIDQLPHTNKDAVVIKLRQQEDLVQDATEELITAMRNDDDDDIEWSEADYILLQSCLGLVKTARACFKKMIEAVVNDGKPLPGSSAEDLDKIWTSSENISSAVDDFVSSLYPPIEKLTVNEMSKSLSIKLINLVEAIRSTHLNSDDENDWIDFLFKAIKHNYEKVQKMTEQKRAG